jgi:hypothetical protein
MGFPFGLIFLGFVLYVVVFGWRETKKARRLVTQGKAAKATVVAKRTIGTGDSVDYILVYKFLLPRLTDGWMRGETKVRKEQYDVTRVGDTITVLYLEDDPSCHELYREVPFEANEPIDTLLRPAAAGRTGEADELLRVAAEQAQSPDDRA